MNTTSTLVCPTLLWACNIESGVMSSSHFVIRVQGLAAWLWLSYRFDPSRFPGRTDAQAQLSKVHMLLLLVLLLKMMFLVCICLTFAAV